MICIFHPSKFKGVHGQVMNEALEVTFTRNTIGPGYSHTVISQMFSIPG